MSHILEHKIDDSPLIGDMQRAEWIPGRAIRIYGTKGLDKFNKIFLIGDSARTMSNDNTMIIREITRKYIVFDSEQRPALREMISIPDFIKYNALVKDPSLLAMKEVE